MNYQYDVFLSYAVEDKLELANELCQKLEERGLSVWYAGRELIIGNSIEQTVREGLERSRYGIVIVTRTYFEKKWTLKELYTLMSKETETFKIIIPVFHSITPDEVAIHDRLLSERWALQTDQGLDHVADEILKRIKHKPSTKKGPKSAYIYAAVASLITATFLLFNYLFSADSPTDAYFAQAIELRIDEFQQKIEDDLKLILEKEDARPVDKKHAVEASAAFSEIKTHYRNYYEFSNGVEELQFMKYVGPATGIDFESWSPVNNYGFDYPNIYLVEQSLKPPYINQKYIYFNTQPVQYTIEKIDQQDSVSLVQVSYTQQLRLAAFHYEYTPQTDHRKHTTYSLKGFLPNETYVFSRAGDGWKLANIQ